MEFSPNFPAISGFKISQKNTVLTSDVINVCYPLCRIEHVEQEALLAEEDEEYFTSSAYFH